MTERITAPSEADPPPPTTSTSAVSAKPAARAAAEAGDRIEIRIPAAGAYLALLRTAVAGLAARLDFTLDDIDDLRIAVDEASALVLTQLSAGDQLECAVTLSSDAIAVAVSGTAEHAQPPRRDTFAWTVLTALVDEVDAHLDDGRISVILRKFGGAAA